MDAQDIEKIHRLVLEANSLYSQATKPVDADYSRLNDVHKAVKALDKLEANNIFVMVSVLLYQPDYFIRNRMKHKFRAELSKIMNVGYRQVSHIYKSVTFRYGRETIFTQRVNYICYVVRRTIFCD